MISVVLMLLVFFRVRGGIEMVLFLFSVSDGFCNVWMDLLMCLVSDSVSRIFVFSRVVIVVVS